MIDPALQKIKLINCSKHVLWVGLGAQARQLDAVYSNQAREATQKFNKVVFDYVTSKYQLPYLDVWELTKDAQTSDGFHYLTDVNLVKAQYVVSFMNLRLLQNP